MTELPLLDPSLLQDLERDTPYLVILHNDEEHLFNEVIAALMRATSCDVEEASIETWEAHTYGQANVHFASEQECREAAATLQRTGLKADVRREWTD